MKSNLRRINLGLLVLAALLPNVGITFNTFGFHWTIGRILFFLSLLFFLCCSGLRITVGCRKFTWAKFLASWLIYGAILLIISRYSPMHNGVVELIALFNGFLCIAILNDIKVSRQDIDTVIVLIFTMLVIYILLGIIEINTGYHLPTSEYSDVSVMNDLSVVRSTRGATGPMYGGNDFSAMLTCLLPIGLYKKKWRPLFFASLIGVIYIDFVNDANICLIGIIIGTIFYLVAMVGLGKNGWRAIRLFFLFIFITMSIFVFINLKGIGQHITLFEVINVQIQNYKLGFGSLYARLIMYLDSLKASVDTFFLGIGPAGFSEYFKAHPSSSGLTNPHNMYLEVLVQYGLIITALFVTGLIKLIVRCRKLYCQVNTDEEKNRFLALTEIFLLYSIVCLASSSFIGYSYQWLLIGVGSALAGQKDMLHVGETERTSKAHLWLDF